MTWDPMKRLQQRIVMPRLHRPDVWLLIPVAVLVGIGIVMVLNSSYFFAGEIYADPYVFVRRQLLALGVGTLAVLVLSYVRLEWFERLAYPVFGVFSALLVLVMIPGIGVSHGGAQRWVPLGPFSFQPSEFAKTAVVLYLARAIAERRGRMGEFRTGIVPQLLLVGMCVACLVRQPDFGTSVILLLVLGIMLFGGGARVSHLVGLALVAAPFAYVAVRYRAYRWDRVLAFLNPWEYRQDIAFQLVQSLIAFGSGGWAGCGLGESRQKMFFLPAAHTDFIFALVGEELGVLGALFVLSLYALLGARGFRIALRHPDPFARMLAFGITSLILLQVLVNVGVVLGLLPTKGLALPFLSYGGSALIGTMIQIGILAALSRMAG